MATRKEALKGKLKAWVSAGSPSENYGFGSNWSLNVGKKDKVVKSFWLGQGAKVTSRTIGLDYGDYVKNTTKRAGLGEKKWNNEKSWIGNKKINRMVTEDIIHSNIGDEYIDDELGWSGIEINSKFLKKLLKNNSWDLAVQ